MTGATLVGGSTVVLGTTLVLGSVLLLGAVLLGAGVAAELSGAGFGCAVPLLACDTGC
ncbi:MAG TPA: hypothetical protein VG247_29310 [Pseudonocardiaceae bacterium]|nr:hypothetical protein [Pseudonocardiaceae bacterium]